MGPKTQGGPLTLHLLSLAIHQFCILTLVTWLSDGYCQEKTKQNAKTCMLRDNGSNAHYSYWCYGGTGLPPLELVIQGEVR